MATQPPTLDDFKRQIAQLANRHHKTANRCFPAGFGIQAHRDRGELIALAVELLGRLRAKAEKVGP